MRLLWIYSSYENLGVEMLTAALRARGHEVGLVLDPRLFDDHFNSMPTLAPLFSFRKRVLRAAVAWRPDAILFSVVSDDFPWFRDMAASIRKALPAPIIAGGIHITSAPTETLEESVADYGVIGEGEEALIDLIGRIESGASMQDMPNLAHRVDGRVMVNPPRPPIPDLDTLPLADKTIFNGTSYSPADAYTIMGTRGCPFRCTFCNSDLVAALYGKVFTRRRSPEHIIAELRMARERYAPRLVNFLDETFGYNRPWLEQLAGAYARDIRIPSIACTNPIIVNEDYVRLLQLMNCRKVDMGVQTVNPELKRRILNRRETVEQTRAAIERLQAAGIQVAAENIINLPGETEDHLTEMAHFYNVTRPDILKVFWLRYYPATRILDIAIESGGMSAAEASAIRRGRLSGSLAGGGPKTSPLTRRFYVFFILMRLFPRGVNEWILKRRFYRFLSIGPLIHVSYILLRLLGRKGSPEAEIMPTRHKKHFFFYLKKWLMGRPVFVIRGS